LAAVCSGDLCHACSAKPSPATISAAADEQARAGHTERRMHRSSVVRSPLVLGRLAVGVFPGASFRRREQNERIVSSDPIASDISAAAPPRCAQLRGAFSSPCALLVPARRRGFLASSGSRDFPSRRDHASFRRLFARKGPFLTVVLSQRSAFDGSPVPGSPFVARWARPNPCLQAKPCASAYCIALRSGVLARFPRRRAIPSSAPEQRFCLGVGNAMSQGPGMWQSTAAPPPRCSAKNVCF